jgi:hypothetical protein
MRAEAMAAAARVRGGFGGQAGGEVCRLKGLPGSNFELNGHKKTVSESETVAGQQSEKTTEMPKATSGKPMVAKTFRSTRSSLLSRVPRFVNRFFG